MTVSTNLYPSFYLEFDDKSTRSACHKSSTPVVNVIRLLKFLRTGLCRVYASCLSIQNTLYNTLVLPYLSYCNIIWANNKPTRLNPLLVLQKRCMRIITNSHYNAHALPLFSKLNQLTIFDLNKLLIATFMFRHHKNCLPGIFKNYFYSNYTIHDYFTRISTNLHIVYARTDVMRLLLRICGPRLWNSIDSNIISNSRNWHSFKRLYKKHLILNYI